MSMEYTQPATDGLGIVGSLFKGVFGFITGNKQAQAERYAAQQARDEAGVAAQMRLAEGDQVTAQAAVSSAANGGGFTGSTIGVIQNLSNQAVFNARALVYRGEGEARKHLYQAGVAKTNATMALINAGINAATQAASMMAGAPPGATPGSSVQTGDVLAGMGKPDASLPGLDGINLGSSYNATVG